VTTFLWVKLAGKCSGQDIELDAFTLDMKKAEGSANFLKVKNIRPDR